ncbi:MAG: glycosyltransferase [Bacteroidales bacterium]|nr:glycosyltransferase [Bacteroidales bacterium]
MKTKATFIISNINKALAFEWIAEYLDKEKFELSFILLNKENSELEKYLKNNNIPVYRIKLNNKKSYPVVFIKLLRLLIKIKPALIHTHLRDANFLGLFAGKILRIKKRIYTRHHSTYNIKYHHKAVKWDRFVNWLSTDIVAISKNVSNVLQKYENVNPSKIHLLHHGFKLDEFQNVNKKRIEKLQIKYKTDNKHPVIGVIARYIELKGHKYIVPAFKKILKEYPNAFFIFANTNGPDKEEISSLIRNNLPEDTYVEIKFEKDLFALYKLFNIYVHTPIDPETEAFGQTYVEALAAGIPSVFTLSGVAPEFIKDRKNALVIDYKNSNELYNKISELINDPSLKDKLKNNSFSTLNNFTLKLFIEKLEKLYDI